MGIRPIPLRSRFWKKVDVKSVDECWLWTASKDKDGYGWIGITWAKYVYQNVGAHVASWFLTHGRMPPVKSVVMHTCDQPSCVNPHHLKLGTMKDNARDAAQKGRTARGSKNSQAVLTTEDVVYIRRLFAMGITKMQIASLLGRS